MVTSTLKEQILNHLDTMTQEQQQQVLEFTLRLARPRGVPARTLLQFAGRIAPDDLVKMEEAIADCEKVDLDEW
jgi:hypothetical protein